MGYVRASTAGQVLTADAQRRTLEAHASDHGLELLEVYADQAKSGGLELERRPGWVELLEGIGQHNAGTVLTVSLSRVARSVYLAGVADRQLEARGAVLVDLETAHLGDGRTADLTRNILRAVAQDERRVIGDRTRRLLRDLKGQGRAWNGTAPYGLRFVDGRAVPHELEQKAIRALRGWRRRGLSIRRCCELLEERGHPARGERWHPTTVARIVRRLELEP